MTLPPLGKCTECGDVILSGLCGECAEERITYERKVLIDDLAKIWDTAFPDETDGWEYPGQIGRSVIDEIKRLQQRISELESANEVLRVRMDVARTHLGLAFSALDLPVVE